MAAYRIEFTEGAKVDLAWFSLYERRHVVAEIRRQLTDQPTVQTRNRKELRNNPVARWELRIGKHRVFYEADSIGLIVTVAAVGFKAHNVLHIRGKEVEL